MAQAMLSAAEQTMLVVLRIGAEEYGIEISKVREIITMQPITRFPGAETRIEGVTTLRGNVLPVLDLRKRFASGGRDLTGESRIMILEADGIMAGVIVDSVSRVQRVPAAQVEAPPAILQGTGMEVIQGIVKVEESLILLLDVGRILSADIPQEIDVTNLTRAAHSA